MSLPAPMNSPTAVPNAVVIALNCPLVYPKLAIPFVAYSGSPIISFIAETTLLFTVEN